MMNSRESVQAWLKNISAELKEINDEKAFLSHKKDELYMKIELLTKLRHQLKTNLLGVYKKELEQTLLEIHSLDDLKHDLELLESNIKPQVQLVNS